MLDFSLPVPPALGALVTPRGTTFRLWSPPTRDASVVLYRPDGAETHAPLARVADDHFEVVCPEVGPGSLYQFCLDGRVVPDPYARFLPRGNHGPAQVIDPTYPWQNRLPAAVESGEVFYELHVGTFTPEGTLRAAQHRLEHVAQLGVTTVELLPLCAFPGQRGWGYDGAAPFALHAAYGTPADLQAFVDAAHGRGLRVVLDVVFNHFGPDGNYLPSLNPAYLSKTWKTPWGAGWNTDDRHVRALMNQAVAFWLETYRFDGLRFDATQFIQDRHTPHILDELTRTARGLRPDATLIAEDARNDPRVITQHGFDGIWADDLHHQLHVLLTGETYGYYESFAPRVADLARTIERGWLFEGQTYSHWQKPRGAPADQLPAQSFVVYTQNHDQVGNRAFGERLNHLVSPAAYDAASALLLFLPFTPLLFMGQEWAATTPFFYFTDHQDERLANAVRTGRHREFGELMEKRAHRGHLPDPQAESTFRQSTLNWQETAQADHRRTLELYQHLLRLRRDDVVLRHPARTHLAVGHDGDLLWVRRQSSDRTHTRLFLANFSATHHAPVTHHTGPDPRVLLRTGPLAPVSEGLAPYATLLLAEP